MNRDNLNDEEKIANPDNIVFDNIQDYEDANIKEEDGRSKNYWLSLAIIICGLFIFSILLNISSSLKNFWSPLGYISLLVFIILFAIYYVKPMLMFLKIDTFEIDSSKNAKFIKKHNIEVRKKIAKKIIDFQNNVKNSNWYDNDLVVKLSGAVKENNDDAICKHLTYLMNGSIKKASDKIIVDSAVQSGIYAALSPSANLDALLVFTVNFKMIKNLVFLYGFRPTEPKLIKIALRVLFGSFLAYKFEGLNIGAIMTGKTFAKSMPMFKESVAYAVDAAIQGFTNATLTMWVGYKTLNYLMKEYKLQLLYENIDILDDQKELYNTREQIFDILKKKMPSLKFPENGLSVGSIAEGLKNNIPFLKKDINKNTNSVTEDTTYDEFPKINEIIMPVSANSFIGKPFIDVQNKLLSYGFLIDNIKISFVKKEKKGFFKKDGEVVEIYFNDNFNIEKGDVLPIDTIVEMKAVTYA